MKFRGPFCTAIALICAGGGSPAIASELYRELTGEGRPTLRQLALEAVLALGNPPALYWALGVGLLTLLVGLSVVAFREDAGPPRAGDRVLQALLDRRLYGAVVALTIVAFRWPFLSRFLLNSDEAHSIACAMKLAVDPVFWRGVDGTTGGPLLYYPLLLPKLFGLSIDYGSARLVGLLSIVGSVLLLYGALRRVLSDGVARLAVLPLVTCVSLFTEPHFVHYSSEHVPIFLISLALYFFCRWWNDPSPGATRRNLLACGFVLGCLPLAKLQAVPVGLFLALCGFVLIVARGRRRRVGVAASLFGFAGAGLAAPLAVSGLLFALGAQQDLWQSYVLNNLAYSGRYVLAGHSALSMWSKLGMVAERAFWTFELSEFVGATAVCVALAMALVLITSRKLLARSLGVVAFSTGLLVSAALSVAIPNTLFKHYFLFLLVPITFFGAVWLNLVAEVLKQRARGWAAPVSRWLVLAVFLGFTVVYPFGRRVRHQQPVFAQASADDAVLRSDVALTVLAFASPGEAMALWGWEPWRFVETGLYPGVRDTHTQYQILETPQRPYYLERFVSDLLVAKPPVFVDSVGYVEGPLPWRRPVFWDRATHAHDAFPEVAEVIRAHYRFLGEVGTARVYVLEDRVRELESRLARRLEARSQTSLLELAPELIRLRRSGDG